MGFIPDIERIFSLTPFTRQTLFFSATMAPEIERITNTFLSAPERIEVARQATASETIEQGVVMFKPSRRENADTEKRDLLRAMIDGEGDGCTNAIIFCNRKVDVDVVAKSLVKHGYDAAPIHGDLDQSQRTRTLDGFRAGTLRFLIASDVAARGLDVPAVSHVFNYDVPSHPEDYIHRIGRTGRAGRSGKTLMICAPRDEKNLAAIEALIRKPISRVEGPVLAVARISCEPEAAPTEKSARPRRTYSRNKADDARPASLPIPASDVEKTAEVSEPVAAPEAPQRNERRSSGRPDRERGAQGGGTVLGMGDHLPSFIALSFEERRAG